MSVRFDKYGLHAEDCGCLRCESGHRPSAGERWRAREQYERTQKMMAALQKEPSKAELARMERRRLADEKARQQREDDRKWREAHPPLTAEEARVEMQRLKQLEAEMCPALAGGSRR